MKFTDRQRKVLILGIGVALATMLVLGGLHHDHHDAGTTCWYCVTATAALLPLAIALTAFPLHSQTPLHQLAAASPRRWRVVHPRRGPPFEASQA